MASMLVRESARPMQIDYKEAKDGRGSEGVAREVAADEVKAATSRLTSEEIRREIACNADVSYPEEGESMSSTLTAPPIDTNTETTQPTQRGMTTRTLRTFFALAFGLGWGVATLMVIFKDQVEAIFGEISMTNPVFILVVYSPAIAGIFLVWRHYGTEGLRSYFRRVTLWRMPRGWWAFLIVGIPAIVYIGAAIKGTVTEFDFSPWYVVFGALAITLIIGPIEEFGWRGVALPLLQRRFAPLWASLILGAFWGLWHAPAFLLSGTKQASWSFPAFVIGVLALAVIVTPMFNAARGSILIAGLFHFQVNGPVWPDAQPWDTLVYVIAAVIVLVLNRKTMLTREGAVAEVLMPGDEERINRAKAAPPSHATATSLLSASAESNDQDLLRTRRGGRHERA